MAFEANLQGFNLGDAITQIGQYRLVRHDGTNVVRSGAGENGYSLQEETTASAPTTAEIASVMTYGITKVETGAAVSNGARLTSDASGRAITSVTTGDEIVGRALSASGGAGEFIAMVVNPAGGAEVN